MTEIGDITPKIEQMTRARTEHRVSHSTKAEFRSRRATRIKNGLLALALAFAGESALHTSTAYAEGSTAQSTPDNRTAYLPLVGRNARSLGSIPSPTTQPPIIPTPTPGNLPPTEPLPSPTSTAEPSPTPEIKQLISLPPNDRAWTGAASPYAPSGDVTSEGADHPIDLKKEGAGWIDGSRMTIFQVIDQTGGKYQILKSTLLTALGGDADKLPDASQIAVEPETTVKRILADNLELGILPEESNPLASITGQPRTLLRDEFGPAESQQVKNLSPLDEAIHELQTEETNKLQEGDAGVTPVSKPPTVSSSPRGLTNSAFEVPKGKAFKLDASLKTFSRGSIRLGYYEGINLNQPSRLVILWVDGQKVFLADNKPTEESTNTRFFELDVDTHRGVLDASINMHEDRQTLNISIRDLQGDVKTFNHKLPAPMDDKGYYEVDVWTPDTDLNKSTKVNASIEFAQDPQAVANWAEGLDQNSERKADLTFKGDSLKDFIDSNKIAVPHQSGSEIGFNLADITDIAHNGTRGIYDESIAYRMAAAIKPAENQGRELWTAIEGYQPFLDGDLRAQVAEQRKAGNTDYKMIIKYDMRTSTGDQSKDVTMSGIAVDAFHDAFLAGYNNKDFIAAPMIFEPDGTISKLALRGIDNAVLARAQTPAAKAEAYARYVMDKLPDGIEFSSAWILDENTTMGLTQAANIAETVNAANKVDGFKIEEVIIIVNEYTNINSLEGFMDRLREKGLAVGLYGPDRRMTLSEAADLIEGETDVKDGSLILHNPMNRDDASKSALLQRTADGLLRYNSDYTGFNNKPKSE